MNPIQNLHAQEGETRGRRLGKRIADLWHGRVPLARAFWEYAIIYGSIANLVFTLAAFGALAQDWFAFGLLLFLVPLPYNLLMAVSVWRSAARYEGARGWAMLARISVIVWAAIATLA